MNAYPSVVPFAEIQEVVRIVRGKTVAAEKEALANHIWWVQGYVQKMALGDPAAPNIVMGEQPMMSDEAACEVLASIAPEGTVQAVTIPWKLLLKWAIDALLRAL